MSLNQNQKGKVQVSPKKLLACFMLFAILGGAIAYPIVGFAAGTIGKDPFFETASYVIFKDGSTVYAKNGDTGAINYYGTNTTQVWENVRDALTPGRTWKERVVFKGRFTIDSTIYVPSYTLIDLSNAYLTMENGANVDMFKNSDPASNNDIEIIGGTIDMNAPNQAGLTSAIYLSNSRYVRIRDINIQDVQYTGIWLNRTDYAIMSGLSITKNEVGGGFAGILIDGDHNIVSDNHIVCRDYERLGSGMCVYIRNLTRGNQIVNNYLEGPEIAISASEYTNYDMVITNNICNYTYATPQEDGSWNGGGGIWVTSIRGVINDNLVINGGSTGILIATDSYNNVVSGNTVGNFYYEGIDVASSSTYDFGTLVTNNVVFATNRSGIRLANVHNVTVTNNKIFDNSSYDMQHGIWEYGTADNNYIAMNDIRDAETPISIAGKNTVVKYNFGFPTENSGVAEASNDDWIPFGVTFAGTPQSVTLTVQKSDARYIAQVKAKNTTHFQLSLYFVNETACTADKTISWHAEYRP